MLLQDQHITMQRGPAGQNHAEMPSRLLRFSNVVSYLVFILINTLANQGVFGPTNAEVSKLYNTPLTPASWAFSIWGLIFALQGAGVLYAALPLHYDSPAKRAAVNAIGYGWQLTWLFECLWLVLFPRQTLVTFIFCVIFLFAALASISVTLARVYRLQSPPPRSAFIDRPMYKGILYGIYFLPTSINTAWLSVASCLGITVLVESQGVAIASQTVLAACLAVAVAAAGVFVVLQYGDLAYGGTLIWALTAVLTAHTDLVAQLSVIAVGVLVLICALAVYRKWKSRQRDRVYVSEAAVLQESLLPQTTAGPSEPSPPGTAITGAPSADTS